MWRAGSNEEFNITAEAVDGWMTTENDDVVKPKNCFEFATNSWGKYGGRREGPVSDFSTVYFERRKRANPRGDRFTYYHDSICVRGFSRWPRELETRAALELSKLSFLVTPPISLLCIFVIRTRKISSTKFIQFVQCSWYRNLFVTEASIVDTMNRDIEILILSQVKILINDVENFYIVDTFPSDSDIYMYINRIIDVDSCQESIGRISEKYTVILEIDFSSSFARRIKKLFITTSLLVSVCETVWTNFLLCDHTSICILSREKWDDAHFSLDDKQIKGLLETHRCVLVEFVGKVIKTNITVFTNNFMIIVIWEVCLWLKH